MKFNRGHTLLLGILALPAGAFCFGVCIPFVCLIAHLVTGENFGNFPSGDDRFMPLTEGATYALLSVISVFAVILFPLAVHTTFCCAQ
jgi:hypothetical protein